VVALAVEKWIGVNEQCANAVSGGGCKGSFKFPLACYVEHAQHLPDSSCRRFDLGLIGGVGWIAGSCH